MVVARTLAEDWSSRLFGNTVPFRHPAYSDYTEFKKLIYSRYQHGPHLQELDKLLMQISLYVETGGREGIGRAMIAMPPRHGKTMSTSKMFPPWHLGRNPWHRIMMVSYGQDLANKNSRHARNIIKAPVYQKIFPGVRLAPDSQSVREWDIEGTDGEGGASALGIGGGAAGKGAHILIIDDPIKNRKEAESLTYRKMIWAAYTDDLTTRLAPGGAIILMATRWHQDDLSGRVIKNEGEDWFVLNLPALAEENDLLGRNPGEALWPERYPKPVLLEQKSRLGDYGFSSLYQQDPKPAEGGIIKAAWLKPYYRVSPPVIRSVRYWDLAMSEKTSADYTVGLRIDLCEDDEYYISDIAREQVELANLTKYIKGVILSDGPSVRQGMENKGFMTRAIKNLVKDPDLANYVIRGYDVEDDKLTRALNFIARAQMRVIHLREASFTDEYIEECKAFPYGSHDDQIDASSGAYEMINDVTLWGNRKARSKKYA